MKIFPLSIWVFCIASACGSSNTPTDAISSRNVGFSPDLPQEVQIAFYNVENLFNTSDQPRKFDEDFLPEGRYNWTEEKYEGKLSQLGKAIGGMGKNGPHIIGLAEIENGTVVEELFEYNQSILRAYEVIHEESPDMRGIDVALAFDPAVFTYIRSKTIPFSLPEERHYTSRDILLVEGRIGEETLYILVNHWPSRRDGAKESEYKRIRAAELVRAQVDSLLGLDPEANILLMGDFNDDPLDRSIDVTLNSEGDLDDLTEGELYNPMAFLHDPSREGTLVHQGKWNLFDQILLSEELLSSQNGLQYEEESATIYSEELTVGFGRGAANPRRAIFRGRFDPEGYSDHFPVYVKLRVSQP